MKKIVVAGTRSFNDYSIAEKYIQNCLAKENLDEPTSFISGGCRGADILGQKYAEKYGFPIEIHKAEWNKYGRAAGPIRNKEMAQIADIIICFWDQKSKGTKSLIDFAKRLNKTVYIMDLSDKTNNI